jgi:hypothetical protein
MKVKVKKAKKQDAWYDMHIGRTFEVVGTDDYSGTYAVLVRDSIKYIYSDDVDVVKEDEHYDNSNGSLYKFAEDHQLNSYEFDIVKRIVRCRNKNQFESDLEKTKRVIDLYLKEFNYGAYKYKSDKCICDHKVTFVGYDNKSYCLKCHLPK